MHDGHLTLFGIVGTPTPSLPRDSLPPPRTSARTSAVRPRADDRDPAHRRRRHPVTVTPAITATILLAELDIDCLNAEHENSSTTLLPTSPRLVTKVPGMKSIAQPAWYNVGWQKVHMAAAQGQAQTLATSGLRKSRRPPVALHHGPLHQLEQSPSCLVLFFEQHRYAQSHHQNHSPLRSRRSRSALPEPHGHRGPIASSNRNHR